MNKWETKVDFSVDDDGVITGLASVFGTPDRQGDIIQRGAFQGIKLPVPMLFGHNRNDPVGVWTEADETPEGLVVKGQLLVKDVPRAREIQALTKSGALTGMSIGAEVLKAAQLPGRGRRFSSLNVFEISLVTVPAHPQARVTSVKSADAAIALAEAISRAASALRN